MIYPQDFINKIIHGDCLDIMKYIPDKSIDMILCDLPYGKTACKWDIIIPFEPLWGQYKRIIKDHGCIALTASEPFSTYLRLSNIKWYKYDWIWYKNQPTGIGYAKYRPMHIYENIIIFCQGKHIYNKQKTRSKVTDRKLNTSKGKFFVKKSEITGMVPKKKNNPNNILTEFVNPRDVLEFKIEPISKGRLHPTQKPVELFKYLIKTYTHENDLVLDNCIGSGTTAIACLEAGRKYIGIEKEQKYYRIAVKRIMQWKINKE